jgi:hypothetical protein
MTSGCPAINARSSSVQPFFLQARTNHTATNSVKTIRKRILMDFIE